MLTIFLFDQQLFTYYDRHILIVYCFMTIFIEQRYYYFLILCLMIFISALPFRFAFSADKSEITKDYIKENFPDVYKEIFDEGRAEGLKDHSAAVEKTGSTSHTKVKKNNIMKDNEKPLQATKSASSPQKIKAVQPAAKEELGQWWRRSSLNYDPMPEKWLFHTEIQYSFVDKTGNDDGYAHSGDFFTALRKARFTNYLSYKIEKYDFDQSDGEVSSDDYQMFEESLRFDLTKRLYAQAGFFWERDDTYLVEDRDTWYGGFGYQIVDNKRYGLDLFLSYGHQKEEYNSIIVELMDLSEEKTGVTYLSERFNLNITEKLSFIDSFRLIYNLDESGIYEADDAGNYYRVDEEKRYRWTWINSLDYKMNKYLSLVATFKIDYDNNPWPSVLNRDERLQLSMKLSY